MTFFIDTLTKEWMTKGVFKLAEFRDRNTFSPGIHRINNIVFKIVSNVSVFVSFYKSIELKKKKKTRMQ
uniref:Uncharacterized protein n=1 Tax=Caenorhabditis tropicalis TaxID=1561998 RepID=A0A1I7SZ78_9PELO